MDLPRSRPGYGDTARIENPQSGKEWAGPVLYWGTTGCPFLLDLITAEKRWFPPHWVADITPGAGPPTCSCPPGDEMPFNPTCSEHGNHTAISQAARRGEV